jgi:hypothetical protein
MPRATEPAIIGAIGRLAGAFGLMLATTLTVASVAAADDSSARGENDMALLVDRARVAAGLLPLARSQALTRAAQAHAQDMAVQEYMEHEGLDGSTPASRAASEGYATPPNGAWLVVEVISARGDPPQAALDWWLGDGLHRRVVMRSTWRELGIGYAQGGPYGRFWVVLFGCRPNVLPPVLLDGTLSIPDESCGSAPDTFGHVQATRAAQTADATKALDWEPYVAERDWPPGQPAVVHLRDGTGRVLEVTANDPATPTTELP